mgnify:CR=1 FL=1
MSGSELDDRILRALREARIHVWRQQHHGKHEQDRIDAVEWLERYEEISRSSQEKTPTYQETGRGGEGGAVGWHNISSTVSPDLISGVDEETPPHKPNSNPTTNQEEDGFNVERESQLSFQLSSTITNEDA